MDLKQPAGVWTNKFTYGASRRLTNVTSKAGSFSYLLAVGAPSTLTVRLSLPNGSYITNNYDSVARLAGTWLKNSTHTTLNSHQYTYNPANQRTQQVFNTPWSTVNYAYDPIGQLKVADSASASEDRAYDYDSAWNLTNRTVNTTPQTFQVDGLNQLTNSTPGSVSAYDSNGNLISSGGGLLELTYDDENRLSTVQSNLVVYGTNYGVWKTLYSYDGLGRLRRRVESHVMAIPNPGGETDLVSGQEFLESGGGGGGGHPWGNSNITHYIYDGWRVIQERNGSDNVPTVSCTRGTDLGGTLEGAGGIGGLLARSHDFTNCSSTLTYWLTNNSGYCISNLMVWDAYQTYVTDVFIEDGYTWNFSWPAVAGRPYSVRGDSCDFYFIQVYSDEQFPGTLDTRAVDFCGESCMTLSESGLPLCDGASSGVWLTHNYYHADGHGNVTALVSSLETLTASYRYDPFGNTISQSGSLANANKYRFSSKLIHATSGLYYFGYRWYSPNLQRWLNRDPLQERGGINLFAFVRNDPMRFVDPFGTGVTFRFA